MNILHIAPKAIYNDYWGFHENLLPKYHKKLGHNVTIIVSNLTHIGETIGEVECDDYELTDGIRVVRRAFKKYPLRTLTYQNSKLEIWDILKEVTPDLIFYHGLIGKTIYEVVKYKKEVNPYCYIIEDNHLDYNIGSEYVPNRFSNKLRRLYQMRINKKVIPYINRVYGVTPWRVSYAREIFGIPEEKLDLLIMGADEEKIDFDNRDVIRKKIRDNYNYSDDDFVVVTGGKIDKKKKIDVLMEACCSLKGVKLLVFGQVKDNVRNRFEYLLKSNPNITYVGWIKSDKVYDYFFAADLVFFPGQHSVLWEQACASKVPCVFEKWDGMEHVNNGGNSDFVDNSSIEKIKDKIEELKFTKRYYEMKKNADSEATDIYLYSNIAKKSLECAKEEGFYE